MRGGCENHIRPGAGKKPNSILLREVPAQVRHFRFAVLFGRRDRMNTGEAK
jgi:hypothetical protein